MKKKGFTLVELLVVIAIISVLMSVLIVSVGYVQRKAKAAKTKTLISNMVQALAGYGADTKEVYPSGDDDLESNNKSGFTGIQAMVKGICTPADDGGEKNGPYLDLSGFLNWLDGKPVKSSDVIRVVNNQPEPKDAFRNSFRYKSKWLFNGTDWSEQTRAKYPYSKPYRIMSMGINKKTGGDFARDDIYND